MAKITVIDVDLGISIDDIITGDVVDITGKVQHDLDIAIATAKATKQLKEAKEQLTKDADLAFQTAMDAAYNALVDAGDAGLPVSTVMAFVEPVVTTTSAFTTRMKHVLREKGNPYTIDRKKQHGTPFYVFLPYNNQPV